MKVVMNYIRPHFGAGARLCGKHQPQQARFGVRDGALRLPAPRAARRNDSPLIITTQFSFRPLIRGRGHRSAMSLPIPRCGWVYDYSRAPSAGVAQTGSLLYRGLAIRNRRYCEHPADYQSATQQVANLRYISSTNFDL